MRKRTSPSSTPTQALCLANLEIIVKSSVKNINRVVGDLATVDGKRNHSHGRRRIIVEARNARKNSQEAN